MSTHNTLPLTETIAPADEAALSAAVGDAVERGTAVYPIGGGTTLDYGARPVRPGIGLSLGNLRRVIDYPADDMTVTVEAGLTIAELGRRLAEKRQRLPVDVCQPDRATVGGLLATNLSGPRRYGCGTIRDYLLGFRAVDGRGTAFCGGGRVVKNAAGYNMGRLMVGSLGTLGVITQATLMVRPLPEASAMVACDVPDFAAAERLLAALVHTQTLPAAIELTAGPARQDCPVLGPLEAGHAARLIVGFEGMASEVEWMDGQLRSEWRQLGIDSSFSASAAAADRLWHWLGEFSPDVQISVPPSATVGMIERLRELAPNGLIQAHAGNGVIGLKLSGEGRGTRGEGRGDERRETRDEGRGARGEGREDERREDERREDERRGARGEGRGASEEGLRDTSSPLPLRDGQGGTSSPLPPGEGQGEGDESDPLAAFLRQQLRPAVAEAGGCLVVLKCPTDARLTAVDVWGPPSDGATVMRAIKDRFDPQGILNPGRFIYDIL